MWTVVFEHRRGFTKTFYNQSLIPNVGECVVFNNATYNVHSRRFDYDKLVAYIRL